jgi:hypothetical protein
MADRCWLITLRTRKGARLFDQEVSRELFVKTLRILEASGLLKVEAFALSPDGVRLLASSARLGPSLADELQATSERIMQLACRTRRGAFWDRRFLCRAVDCPDERAGLRAVIEATPGRSGSRGDPYQDYASRGERWLTLRATVGASML